MTDLSEKARKARIIAAIGSYQDRIASDPEFSAREVEKAQPKRSGRKVAADGGPTERDEQRAVVQWLRGRGVPFFAVPNAANRSARFSSVLRSEGMVAGAPDIVIGRRARCGAPIALEMKRARGGSVSAVQKAMHADLVSCGWLVIVGRGAADAIAQLEAAWEGSGDE